MRDATLAFRPVILSEAQRSRRTSYFAFLRALCLAGARENQRSLDKLGMTEWNFARCVPSVLHPHQLRGESAVKAVAEWEERDLFEKFQERKFFHD